MSENPSRIGSCEGSANVLSEIFFDTWNIYEWFCHSWSDEFSSFCRSWKPDDSLSPHTGRGLGYFGCTACSSFCKVPYSILGVLTISPEHLSLVSKKRLFHTAHRLCLLWLLGHVTSSDCWGYMGAWRCVGVRKFDTLESEIRTPLLFLVKMKVQW